MTLEKLCVATAFVLDTDRRCGAELPVAAGTITVLLGEFSELVLEVGACTRGCCCFDKDEDTAPEHVVRVVGLVYPYGMATMRRPVEQMTTFATMTTRSTPTLGKRQIRYVKETANAPSSQLLVFGTSWRSGHHNQLTTGSPN